MTTKSREIVLKKRPVGMPTHDDFELVEVTLDDPTEGQVLVQNLYMSVDPYMRGRMVDRKSYTPPFQVGETLTGGALGRVSASRSPDFAEGDYVQSNFGWREWFVTGGQGLSKLENLQAPASAYLGALGMPGMTAYVGLLGAAQLKDGETVFVSGAAGAVGSIAGQIAKIKGCRTLGSAGGPEKVALLQNEFGFDFAFDYREGEIFEHLTQGAPEGLDVYFDNVGGDHLQAALTHMRPFGRVALCGAISQYNATEPVPGPNNLTMAIGLGLTLRGFIVSHYNDMRADFLRDMAGWIEDGRVRYRETVMHGLEQAPDAFMGLFTGANVGKMIVQLAEAQ